MKLKCETHKRRVLTVPTSNRFLHRTGDMSECDSKTAVLFDNRSRTTRTFEVRNGQAYLVETNKEGFGPVIDLTRVND